MKEETSEYKTLAKNAKKRLQSGFWNEIKAKNFDSPSAHAVKEHLKNKMFCKTYTEDEDFYEKVCNILSSKELITNPIYILADKELMASAEHHTIQVHLSEISEKFQKMSERYQHEHLND